MCSALTQANICLNPATSRVVATDATLAYAATDAYAGTLPGVGTLAYTGSTTSILYAIDENSNHLLTLDAPSNGIVRSLSATPTFSNDFPSSRNTDLDFYYDPVTQTNIGYFTKSAADPASGFATLSVLNPATGIVQNTNWIGPNGGDYEVRDIAVQPAATALATHPATLTIALTLAPNPLTSNAQLRFTLLHATHVDLVVTDALGRLAGRVDAGLQPAGTQVISWHRQDQAGGVYFFTLRFDGHTAGTVKAVLME
ncbi:DUF4394 domain-containing protein [Hymenobacter sp. BRD67]|nr:DUF4394 domain-containing protein [Hymenobacter sp. BRD67]